MFSRISSLLGVFTLGILSLSPLFAKAPQPLSRYLEEDKKTPAEIVVIIYPKEIQPYLLKVQAAAQNNPQWYIQYVKKSDPTMPLTWDEKMGLTKKEYETYLALWNKKRFEIVQKILLRLEKKENNTWMIRVSGAGMPISLLRYTPSSDTFRSPNGTLKRIDDIQAKPQSILGAWQGLEWQFEESDTSIATRENIAIGRFQQSQDCLLIYRLQAISRTIPLENKTLLIRFKSPQG